MTTSPPPPAGRPGRSDPVAGLPHFARRPWRPAVTASAAVCALLLAVAVWLGAAPVFVVEAVAMMVLSAGWVLLLGLPSPRGTTSVLTGASLILLGSGVLSHETRASLMPGAVALAMIVEFVHQLARRDGRPRLVESVSGSVTGIVVLTSGSGILLLPGSAHGVAATVAVMAAVALACLSDVALRWDDVGLVSGLASPVLGAAGAVGAGLVLGPLPPLWIVALAGALAGGSSYGLRAAQSVLPTLFGRRAQLASGVASVLATGALAYGLTWLSVGADMMGALR